jgi:NADH dehydrogenase
VDDPEQSLALTRDHHEGQSSKDRELEKINESKKGKLFDLPYDKLVIAVGCYSQTFGTPGVRENALFLKDVGDARKIRNRLLACFEMAAQPTTSEEMRQCLLNFAIVGGGPTGIEFSAELHDFITQDLSKIYPELIKFVKITVYDVAPKVLSMFDEKLGKYAMQILSREGVRIQTSHHVEELRDGCPAALTSDQSIKDQGTIWTLKTKEDGDIGVGMVVWSTGLQMNPFIEKALGETNFTLPNGDAESGTSGSNNSPQSSWEVKKDARSGAVVTNDKLQVILERDGRDRAILKDVYALGDCALLEGTMFPATAQVAAQKAEWLGKRLNKDDIESQSFKWKNLGVMAYLGNYNAIMQSGGGGNVSGRLAWLIWRGAYLTKTVSLRNKILIPMMWALNWLFGRDTSRKDTPLAFVQQCVLTGRLAGF